MAGGRKSKYDTVIEPRLADIRQWLQNGATENQVADNLGIARSTFAKWKAEKAELAEICKNARQALVLELRGALIKKALGYTFTETKRVFERVTLPDAIHQFLLDNGFTEEQLSQAQLVRTEETQKCAPPDVAAINLALKNYDFENWANDPQLLALKKEELKMKKEHLNKIEW